MKTERKSIFMPLFGEIDYHGRVQRAAEALGEAYDVVVFSLDSGQGYTSAKFTSRVVTLPGVLLKARYLHGFEARCMRGLLYLYFWLALIHAAIRLRAPIVYSHDFMLALPGWIAARLTGAKLVYDPHELIVSEEDPSHNQVHRIWYRLEKWVVTQASIVVAANEERAKIMQAHYSLDKSPLVVRNIPPMPTEDWEEVETLRHYPQLKRDCPNTVRLVYVGHISIIRRVDKFIAAIKHLPHHFQLLLVGDGVDMEGLQQEAIDRGLAARVQFLGKVPESHLHHILKLCDIGIIAYSKIGMNNIYCAPNKVFQYLQAGLPVISTSQPSLQPIIGGFQVGELVDCDQAREEDAAKEIAVAIGRLADDLSTYKARMPDCLKEHNWEAEGSNLLQAVNEL